MQENKDKRVRGPRLYLGAPAEAVMQLKIIAKKRNTHMSVLLLAKVYELIEEHFELLRDELLATQKQNVVSSEGQPVEIAQEIDLPVDGKDSEAIDENKDAAEVIRADESIDTAQIPADDADDVVSDSLGPMDQSHKNVFDGVRSLWKRTQN